MNQQKKPSSLNCAKFICLARRRTGEIPEILREQNRYIDFA